MILLSKNFTLEELTKSQTAVRQGLDNAPNAQQTENLRDLALNVLQPIRDKLKIPFTPSSGFRSVLVNRATGGSENPPSDHLTGCAADIELPGLSNYDLACWIRDNLEFKQCILEYYEIGKPNSGWVHVSYDKNNNMKQCLTATTRNGKKVTLPGLSK